MAEKKVIDKGMIEDFASKIDVENLRNTVYYLSDMVEDIALELSQHNQLINIKNIELIPFNDFSNVELVNSDINLYLAIRSAQIELNSIGPMQKWYRVFWNKIIRAWKNRKSNTRKARKKAAKLAKRKSKFLTIEQLIEKKEKPYTILDLKNDFYNGFIKKLTDSTVIYNQPAKLRILAKEEFGFKINIYPAIKHDDNLKIWNNVKNKFLVVKPYEAQDLLSEKNKEINQLNKNKIEDILYRIIRIYKNIFYSIYNSCNYQFIETLIYNCPNSLFSLKNSKNETYIVFIKILNYLNNINFADYRSIYNRDNKISEQDDISIFAIKNFIKDLNEYLI